MEMLYHLLLLVGAVFQFQTANCISSPISRIDHLPTNIKPESYDLSIKFDFKYYKVPFSGKVGITIICEDNTDTIILNVKELKIVEKDVTVTLLLTEGKTPIKVIAHNYDELRDQYIITLAEKLEARQKYKVDVPFRKESLVDLSDLGLVRYKYEEDGDYYKRVIALTKADINDARRFFPCVDEINSRATFKIRLRVPSHMIGFSSVKSKTKYDISEDQLMYEFEDSIPISPHSLGLAVAEIELEEKVDSTTELSIFVRSRTNISQANSHRKSFFNEMSGKVIDFYFSYFGSLPPVKDYLVLLILPNLPQVNLQKSRLIMLDESTLFTSNPSEQSHVDDEIKADIILHLCSVINGQWLDAGINMSNWNEHWVQIALATFVRAPCVEKILEEKEFNPLDMQLVETFTHVLRNDGESVSRPIYVNKEHFDLTTAFADNILLGKAHLLIKMMHYFLGEKLFQDSVRQYYKDIESKGTSTLDQLWQVFDTIARTKENLLPEDTTIKMIMESWVLKKGYPVINVDIDYEKGTATLKQERFVQLEDRENENETVRYNDYWIIPINLATKAQFEEEGKLKSPVDLLFLKDTAVTIPYTPKYWELLNLQLSVPCRVIYDLDTRKLLDKTLLNKDEYKIIDEKSRIQLVFDMFALAEVHQLSYLDILETMKYLKHEDSDLVLIVALYELNKLHSAFFNTVYIKFCEKYMKEILEKILEKPRFAQIDDLSGRTKQERQLKKLVIELSCKVGVWECKKKVWELFKIFMDNPSGSDNIPEDFREIVYCQAIKHGDDIEWNFLREHYKESNPVHQKAIVTALGCSGDNSTVKKYLAEFHDLTFPLEYHQSIINGLAGNNTGCQVMMYTFLYEYDEIIKKLKGYEDTIGFYFVKLFELANNEEDFNKLIEMTDSMKNQLRGVEDILKDSVRTAKKKVIWLSEHTWDLVQWASSSLEDSSISPR